MDVGHVGDHLVDQRIALAPAELAGGRRRVVVERGGERLHRIERIGELVFLDHRLPAFGAHFHAAQEADGPGHAIGVAVLVVGEHRRIVLRGQRRLDLQAMPLDQLEQFRGRVAGALGVVGKTEDLGKVFLGGHDFGAAGERGQEAVELLDDHRVAVAQ